VKILAFDTETTGLIDSRLKRAGFQPHVIQFAAALIDLERGEVVDQYHTYIKPPNPEVLDTDAVKKSSKITWDMLAPYQAFDGYAKLIREMIEAAPMVAAHNLVFDMGMIDVEMKRVGTGVMWPKQICTLDSTIHVTGYRLSLTELHKILFDGQEFAEAHDARADVAALTRCLIEMHKRDWI
jgi:DNA polymerase-3 subunit epsilon